MKIIYYKSYSLLISPSFLIIGPLMYFRLLRRMEKKCRYLNLEYCYYCLAFYK